MPKPTFEYSKKNIDTLLMGVYMDIVNVEQLPTDLYFATANYLKSGMYEGYGGEIADFKFGTPDYKLLEKLRKNIYIFSGAKTYQQVRHLNSLIYEDNEKLSYKTFKEKALPVYKDYNESYLHTEWNTAITSATTAKQWDEIQQEKDLYTYLRYNAIEDDRTSEICGRLNGTTLKTDDKFWHTHVPPTHFNCRCTLEKIDKYEHPAMTSQVQVDRITSSVDKKMQDVFKMNPGIDKYVYSPKHPYFDIAPKDKDLAKKNFGLPIPKKDNE